MALCTLESNAAINEHRECKQRLESSIGNQLHTTRRARVKVSSIVLVYVRDLVQHSKNRALSIASVQE
jgi:hypothetical protein